MRKNKDEGCSEPCIRLDNGKTKWYAKSVRILGPSRIVQTEYDPTTPNAPFIWIETEAPVEWDQ